MKNIHVIPTDKPSKVYKNLLTDKLFILENSFMDVSECNREYQNIYITSDEKIKEGDWFYLDMSHSDTLPDEIHQMGSDGWSKTGGIHFCEGNSWVKSCKKIILTTDPRLAPDVQKIDDEFLEWFVKNPSCEEVDLDTFSMRDKVLYNVVFPKEEPKQEKSYSEEDMKDYALKCISNYLFGEDFISYNLRIPIVENNNKQFEQFKNK